MSDYFDFLIIGGGIAGVVCAETLCELLYPSPYGLPCDRDDKSDARKVCLISSSKTLKTTVNVRHVTRMLESFDVAEKESIDWSKAWSDKLTVLTDTVKKLDCKNQLVYLTKEPTRSIRYGRICLATGAVPRRLLKQDHPLVLTIRDTESIAQFRTRLAGARRVLLVGNGGIATEVAYEIDGCQVVWAVKHENISVPFLDATASQFLLRSRVKSKAKSDHHNDNEVSKCSTIIRTLRYSLAQRDTAGDSQRLFLVDKNEKFDEEPMGSSALGPDWTQGHRFTGIIDDSDLKRPLKVVYHCQVARLLSREEFLQSGLSAVETDADGPLLPPFIQVYDWPFYVELTNGEVYGCDFVVCATGVEANLGKGESGARLFSVDNPDLTLAPANQGGGVRVNELMQCPSIPTVYAAGDCAFADWTPSPHWLQMQLWSQARQTAFQAAKSMYYHAKGDIEVPQDFSFEIFTHMTFFFGFKVVLLGLFNGQGLNLTSPDCTVMVRITPKEEFVKCIMWKGRMQGALLIGETDLEETFENLILNQLDLSSFGEHLLDPNVDLGDYFD